MNNLLDSPDGKFTPDNSVGERTLGLYPISIATSLAIQGLFDEMDDGQRYSEPPIGRYQQFWVNMRTLIRNIRGAYPREIHDRLQAKDIFYTLHEEMATINGLITEKTSGKCQVVFYACDYNRLTGLYPYARFKDVKTDRQIILAKDENAAIAEIFKNRTNLEFNAKHFDTILIPEGSKAKGCILSHFPFDLLSRDKFISLELVESHTGVIKKSSSWNTKLQNGRELERIPFDKMTIQMFGDSGGLLSPYPIAYRKELLKVAEKFQWNSTTTGERIRLCVKAYKNADLEILVNNLYR